VKKEGCGSILDLGWGRQTQKPQGQPAGKKGGGTGIWGNRQDVQTKGQWEATVGGKTAGQFKKRTIGGTRTQKKTGTVSKFVFAERAVTIIKQRKGKKEVKHNNLRGRY